MRPALRDDAKVAAGLLYESATGMYDPYAGGRRSALRVIEAAFKRGGTSASCEVVTVAEAGGRVVAAMAAFPVAEANRRASRFLRVSLRHLPPWRWPGALRVYRLGGRATPPPPPSALYVDALATDAGARRGGAAAALLAEAERLAAWRGLRFVALDTQLLNEPARALYASSGFVTTERRTGAGGLPAMVGLVKPVPAPPP